MNNNTNVSEKLSFASSLLDCGKKANTVLFNIRYNVIYN